MSPNTSKFMFNFFYFLICSKLGAFLFYEWFTSNEISQKPNRIGYQGDKIIANHILVKINLHLVYSTNGNASYFLLSNHIRNFINVLYLFFNLNVVSIKFMLLYF